MPTTNELSDTQVRMWLANEDNRVTSNGEPSEFLDSVWSSWLVHRRLTAAQYAGVRRWMARAERSANDPDSAAVAEIPAESYQRLKIPNGHWRVTNRGMNMVSLVVRIHTITYSRRTPGLVGKRVISVGRSTDHTTTIGFLTTEGKLKLWARFADHPEVEVLAVKRLLTTLRETHPRNQTPDLELLVTDDLGEWNLFALSHQCFHCSRTLLAHTNLAAGDDHCTQTRVAQRDHSYIRTRRFGSSYDATMSPIDTYDPPAPNQFRQPPNDDRSRGGSREVSVLSQLGTGWEQ